MKAKNRVGFNQFSNVTSLAIPNNSAIQISAVNFNTYNWEDWREIYVCISDTNNNAEARVIYKQELFEADQYTEISPANLVISSDIVIRGIDGSSNVVVDLAANLPANMPNGFRVSLTSTNRVYEWVKDSTDTVDNLTVLPGTGGRWIMVSSNSINVTTPSASLELFEIQNNDLQRAPLDSTTNLTVPLKYYIINDDSVPLTAGELDLNTYVSDSSLKFGFDVKVLGYLNLSTNSLDTSGIQYVNSVVSYPDTRIQLSKDLPVNSAFVVEVYPNLISNVTIEKGVYITLYPKLSDYTIIDDVKYHGNPVTDIAALKALPESLYRANQVRFVLSKRTFYFFDENAGEDDDGDTIIRPNFNPVVGRWRVLEVTIADESITVNKLSDEVLELIGSQITTTTLDITDSTAIVLNLDNSPSYDYYIIKTPIEDGDDTTINVTATLSNNQTKAILLELRQKTGSVIFDNSLLFPNGTLPIFSGNNKTDLFLILLNKDSNAVLKKRIFMVQKNIG